MSVRGASHKRERAVQSETKTHSDLPTQTARALKCASTSTRALPRLRAKALVRAALRSCLQRAASSVTQSHRGV